MSNPPAPRILATLVCDLERSPLGTTSRLLAPLAGTAVLARTLSAVLPLPLEQVVLLAPEEQLESLRQEVQAWGLAEAQKISFWPLVCRAPDLHRHVIQARAWNLTSWRGGASQLSVFDEDFHPQALWQVAEHFKADHLLCVPAHAGLISSELLARLIDQHLNKNTYLRMTFTPAAPGLGAMMMRAELLAELSAATIMPGFFLGYHPDFPSFDPLMRTACLQVEPEISKIPNRFLLDTERSWKMAQDLLSLPEFSPAVGPAGGALDSVALARRGQQWFQNQPFRHPREVEIQLTSKRLTEPPGAIPPLQRKAALPPEAWQAFFARQSWPDDQLLTLGGDGEPLLYEGFLDVLRAARRAGIFSIHLQSDLSVPIDPLMQALQEDLVDVISVNFYGDDPAVYHQVCGLDAYPQVLDRMEELMLAIHQSKRGGPILVPRLLKLRATIPQMEAFFDRWVKRCGWAVFDAPTDRAGSLPMTAVIDMAPPRRRACRRIFDRLLIGPDGLARACDQDLQDQLQVGSIQNASLESLWAGLADCRQKQLAGAWQALSPCNTCREWHRA